tara:strand:- start:6952 stop:7656 length:705 start_codon:yes stop_codon:yes gene_type:complete
MANKYNILGIIPAREGSKRLPGKNTMLIGKKSLLEIAIDSANKSKYLNRVILSTESKKYINFVKNLNVEVPFIRPCNLADDNSSTWDVVRHAVDFLIKQEKWQTDIVVILQPNTPFRTAKHIDKAIKLILDGADSAMSIREVDYPPEWMYRINKNGNLEKLLTEESISRTQDSKQTYQPNGLVYALKAKNLRNKIPMPNTSTKYFLMTFNDSINIDEEWQFNMAKLIYEQKNIT